MGEPVSPQGLPLKWGAVKWKVQQRGFAYDISKSEPKYSLEEQGLRGEKGRKKKELK